MGELEKGKLNNKLGEEIVVCELERGINEFQNVVIGVLGSGGRGELNKIRNRFRLWALVGEE